MNRNLILHRDGRGVWDRDVAGAPDDEARWMVSMAGVCLLAGLAWWAFASR